MTKTVYNILQNGQLDNKRFALFRLHNSYKQIDGNKDYRALELGELPDVKKITNVYDITVAGAIKKAEMLMLKLLSTYEFKSFNTAFSRNALIIDFVNVTNPGLTIEGNMHSNWTIVMSAFNPQSNESVVIETLLIRGDILEE